MIKTFEQYINKDINIDILCEGEECWWNKGMCSVIISYDGEIKNTYMDISEYSLSRYVDEFVKYISILTLADIEKLEKKNTNTNKRFIKGYTLKNPKRNEEWETCSIFLFKGGDAPQEFEGYINDLKKQVKELGYEEKKKRLK
jgi:hypothetical protein